MIPLGTYRMLSEQDLYGIIVSRELAEALAHIRRECVHAFAQNVHHYKLPMTEIRFSSIGILSHRNIMNQWTGH